MLQQRRFNRTGLVGFSLFSFLSCNPGAVHSHSPRPTPPASSPLQPHLLQEVIAVSDGHFALPVSSTWDLHPSATHHGLAFAQANVLRCFRAWLLRKLTPRGAVVVTASH